MSSRLLSYETRTVSQIFTYLTPSLKSGFRQPENMLSAKELVRKELSLIIKESDRSVPPTMSTSEQADHTSNDELMEQKKSGLLDFLKQRRPYLNSTASAINILRMYMETNPPREEEEDTIVVRSMCAFWSHNKHLAPLNTIALKYLVIPATSVPLERMDCDF